MAEEMVDVELMKWVNIEDKSRQPAIGVNYLTVDENGRFAVYYFDAKIWRGWGITHWMPIVMPILEGD